MGRLGTVVGGGAFTAPVGGMVAADAPGTFLPASVVEPHPEFFDLNGWYAGVDTGVALVASGDVWPGVNDFGNAPAAHWPAPAGRGHASARRFMRDAIYRARGSGGTTAARTAFGRTTFKTLAAHPVRPGMRWSFEDAVLAK